MMMFMKDIVDIFSRAVQSSIEKKKRRKLKEVSKLF